MFRLGEKFLSRNPPPPSKGKNFWHQIWLDTCSDWGEKFCRGTPPPSKGKNFWHQIWLDTCSDWEKKFLLRDPPPPPRIARNCYGYAAGGMPLAFTPEDFLLLDVSLDVALDVCDPALTFWEMLLLDVALDVALYICKPTLTIWEILWDVALDVAVKETDYRRFLSEEDYAAAVLTPTPPLQSCVLSLSVFLCALSYSNVSS